MQRFLQYWHTLRHLKPVQFYGRLWFRLHTPKIDLRAAPSVRSTTSAWVEPVAKHQTQFGAMTFRFLNQDQTLSSADAWNDARCDKLWLYNLHYFDDLCAAGASDRIVWHKQLIEKWIAENPPAIGNGWEPYPTSLRIVNWIKWSLGGNQFTNVALQSLAIQSRWLSKRVEHHLLANHLFVNAKALVFAGMFFQGLEADSWLNQGLRILAREIPEQVLADGGHFELSPMYHAIILEDILDLINACQSWPSALALQQASALRAAAQRMLSWLEIMSHPDGDVSFFNDAAFGIAPRLIDLSQYANRLGVRVQQFDSSKEIHHLQQSGYIRAQKGAAVLLADVGRIGPDYQPGHAHADTLSFEFSLGEQRIFVNSGTSTYKSGAQRSLERSTAAHNTIEINHANSSEVWGGFRVARRAQPFGIECVEAETALAITASHTGYQRLIGRPTHQRMWKLSRGSLTVTDQIKGELSGAIARLYLHPSVKVLENNMLTLANGQHLRYSTKGAIVTIVDSVWHPEFGKNVSNTCLVLTLNGSESVFELQWS